MGCVNVDSTGAGAVGGAGGVKMPRAFGLWSLIVAKSKPVAMGVVGMGGYARSVLGMLGVSLEAGGGPRVAVDERPLRVVAACDPSQANREAIGDALDEQGVAVLDDIDALLARPEVEAVWLPVPIGLHRPFTEKALAAGKAVMCEKPAAGCVQDVDAMIAARDRAARDWAALPVAIGFQDIYHPATLALKRQLLDGAIGPVREATLWACWPRGDGYYSRNDWAGVMRRGDTWVLDSPANNALSHFINLALFILGTTDADAARIETVEAELYRAREIENYDTISLRLTLGGGVRLLVMLTHACGNAVEPRIDVTGEAGSAAWRGGRPVVIRDATGRDVRALGDGDRPHGYMVERFAKLVRGEADGQRAVATLEVARAQVAAVNAASQAVAVVGVPASAVQRVECDSGSVRAITGIEQVFEQCAATGRMLHESGAYAWTQPAGRLTLPDGCYPRFEGPCLR